MKLFKFTNSRMIISKKYSKGFTILELMTVIAIMGILFAVAVPAFNNLVLGNRVLSEVRNLQNDLQFARTEAIRQGIPITVCVSTNGTSCSSSSNWNLGWIVFTDIDGNQVLDTSTETILKKQAVFVGNDTLTASNSAKALTYGRNGFIQTEASVSNTSNLGVPSPIWISGKTTPSNCQNNAYLHINVAGALHVFQQSQASQALTKGITLPTCP